MASGMTDALENAVINHFFRNTSQTATAAFLALYSTAPTDSTQGTELSATNGYARESVTFSAPSTGSTANTNTITFTASGGAWSAIVGHALCASGTAGTNDAWVYEDSVAGPTLSDGDSYEFGASDITLSFA